MLQRYDVGPVLAVRLLTQMSRVRIIFTFALLAGVLTAPSHILQHPPAAYGAISLAALLAIYSYFAADWSREYTQGRLNLSVALTVLGDVAALTLFIYATFGTYSYFFALMLCEVVFAAIFFHGLELVFIVGIVCCAFAGVTLGVHLTQEAMWQVLVGLTAAVTVAWLAHGLGEVLERERLANERLIRHLSEAVCLVNDQGDVLLANPQLERLSGTPLAAFIGKNLKAISRSQHGEMLSRMLEGTAEALKGDQSLEQDVEIAAPEQMVLRRNMVPCPSTTGRTVGWVILWQDITDFVAVARATEEGLSVITHEMRSPLTSLRLLVEVLAGVTGELDEAKRERIIGHLYSETNRLARLVGSVLDLAKFDNLDFSLERKPVDILPLLERVHTMFEARADAEGLKFACDWPAQLPIIPANEDRLEQVLTNLCENALNYVPEGGTITLSARLLADALELAVADTGPGIPEELQERIFEKFATGLQALPGASRSGGLGLGLALSKRIVELHGGTIRVESTPGQGATFIVTLPRQVAAEAPASAAPSD